MHRCCTENPIADDRPIGRSLDRPSPSPRATDLLPLIRTWCALPAADAVRIIDQGVWIPWHVVHAVRTARNLRPWALVVELRQFGRVLAADGGLTVLVRMG